MRRGERRGKEGRSKEMIGDERGGQCKEERRGKGMTGEDKGKDEDMEEAGGEE